MRGILGFVAIGALALLSVPPATAIESVSGSYAGKMTCREIVGGVASKSKRDVTVTIAENMGAISLDVLSDMTPFATAVRGFLAEDASKGNKAKIVGAECGLSWSNHSGSAVHLDVTIPPGSTKGTLKGTLTLMDDGTSAAALCTFSAKRVSTLVAMIAPCV